MSTVFKKHIFIISAILVGVAQYFFSIVLADVLLAMSIIALVCIVVLVFLLVNMIKTFIYLHSKEPKESLSFTEKKVVIMHYAATSLFAIATNVIIYTLF